MKKESDVFENPIRAQLTTTATKQCAFYATMQESEKKVFVKGPYASMKTASIQQTVHEFKKLLVPELPMVECSVIPLLVDKQFLPCQFGMKKTWPDSNPAYYLVCEDFLQPHVNQELPTKWKDSVMWNDRIKVVDFDHSFVKDVFSHAWYNSDVKESMYTKIPGLALQYVLHVLLSWVCGCGADLANRNFFIHDGNMYQIDLETWANFTWVLSSTAPVSKRTQAGKQFLGFIQHNWGFFEPVLKTAQKNLCDYGKQFFVERELNENDLKTMMSRIEDVLTLEGVTQVCSQDRAVVQKKSKKVKVM